MPYRSWVPAWATCWIATKKLRRPRGSHKKNDNSGPNWKGWWWEWVNSMWSWILKCICFKKTHFSWFWICGWTSDKSFASPKTRKTPFYVFLKVYLASVHILVFGSLLRYIYIYIHVFGMGEFFLWSCFASGTFLFRIHLGWIHGIHVVTEERKKLHNLVLELKGNIRVFVRVSWFKYLEGYTSDGGSVVGGRCFSPMFFFLAVSEDIHSPPCFWKRNIKENLWTMWVSVVMTSF